MTKGYSKTLPGGGFTCQRLTGCRTGRDFCDRMDILHMQVELPSPLVLDFVEKLPKRVSEDEYEEQMDEDSPYSAFFVRVGDPTAKCNVTGKPFPWWGRKFYISPHMTDGEIVQTIFLACKVAQEHELREQFKYKGQSIFDPHYDIDKLVELRAAPDALAERTEA